jgi:hypothetical protein
MLGHLHMISYVHCGGSLKVRCALHYAGELPWVCETQSSTISDMELIRHRFADVCIHHQRGVFLGELYTRPDRCFKRLRYHLNSMPGMQRLLIFWGRKLFCLSEAVIAKLTYSNRIRRADMKKAYAVIEAKVSKMKLPAASRGVSKIRTAQVDNPHVTFYTHPDPENLHNSRL